MMSGIEARDKMIHLLFCSNSPVFSVLVSTKTSAPFIRMIPFIYYSQWGCILFRKKIASYPNKMTFPSSANIYKTLTTSLTTHRYLPIHMLFLDMFHHRWIVPLYQRVLLGIDHKIG